MASLLQQSQATGPAFNWVFLVELIVCGILCLFFFFYFNRLFAALVSYGIRAYTSHYYHAYVDIQALQISLLGGRIFFKGIRYHGVNEAIWVHGGFISWNYWKRSVKGVDLLRARGSKSESNSQPIGDKQGESYDDSQHSVDRGEKGGIEEGDTLPCRIAVTIYGLEWFIYNRTPAYDDLLSGFGYPTDPNSSFPAAEVTSYQNSRDGPGKEASIRLGRPAVDANSMKAASSFAAASVPRDQIGKSESEANVSKTGEPTAIGSGATAPSRLLRLLPVKLECTRGAIVIGNQNTRSILTSTFEKAAGMIDATDSGPLDHYRQSFTFEFHHPIVQLRPNPDFKQEQLVAAIGLGSFSGDQGGPRVENSLHPSQRRKRKLWHNIRDLIPYFQNSVESFHIDHRDEVGPGTTPTSQSTFPGEARWLGLTRYLDNSRDEHEGWDTVEYGRVSTLMDCPALMLSYYWDVPGIVPFEQYIDSPSWAQYDPNDINGSNPPEWGLDLRIEGGTINYGPWADRERICLQNVFFPNTYRSVQPAKSLEPGDLRESTTFKVRLEINQDTTLRIPTREESKDWQWKDRIDTIRCASMLKNKKQKPHTRNKEGEAGNVGPEVRPFGWLSLRVARDSTITYDMDIVPSKNGYRNSLTLDLCESKLSSSVNHGLLWQCPRQVISCDLSNPLIWNNLRDWVFNVQCSDLEVFLLRDHIFLLIDLVNDWVSGPPTDYYTFVPFFYTIKPVLTNFRLFLNVNDSNIINNPSDLDDNAFVVVKGKELKSNIEIPATKYRPEENDLTFDLYLVDGSINLLTPLWHTLHTFQRDKSVATLKSLVLEGHYSYNLSASPALTDTLLLKISGELPFLCLYGFLIRYFTRIRDNYFGEEMHFKTLEEFQEASKRIGYAGAYSGINPNRKGNELDVTICIIADNAYALLPANIYDHSKALRLAAVSIEADMRFTNYYMDLQTTFSPIEVALETLQSDDVCNVSNTQLFVDGVSIYGHRLFGLPPTEPTYVCNWDFEVGRVVGECSPDFLRSMIVALRTFDFTLDDEENALPPLHPISLHDVTFLRTKIESIHMAVVVEDSVFILDSGITDLRFNDWARGQFSKRLSLTIPDITAATVDRKSTPRHHGKHKDSAKTYALLQTKIKFVMLQRMWNFVEDQTLQQRHITLHDQRTHRTPWLLFALKQVDASANTSKDNPPSMPVPFMPEPIVDTPTLDNALLSGALFAPESFPARRSSFLSAGAAGLNSNRILRRDNLHTDKHSLEATAASPELTDNVSVGKQSHYHRPSVKSSQSLHSGSIPGGEPFLTFSSPWMAPHFQHQQAVPDTSQLPTLPPITCGYTETANDRDFINVPNSFEERDGTSHVGIFCELDPGLTGFCTPEFLFSVSSFLQAMRPSHPMDILDSLQMGVVSRIVYHKKSLKIPKKAMTVSVKIPSTRLRLINSPVSIDSGPQFHHQDEYNVSFTNFKTILRTKAEHHQDATVDDDIHQSLVVHATIDTFSASAESRKSDGIQEDAKLRCSLTEAKLCLMTSPGVRCHLQTRLLDIVTSTKSANQLALLVHRATALLNSLISSFEYTTSATDRLRSLVYSLIQSAADIPDPLFLTRPSYILSASGSHLRLDNAWKTVSRLRNVCKNLPYRQQQALISDCNNPGISYPKDAKFKVLSSLDQWRNWDLAHAEKSYIMKKIWGDSQDLLSNPASRSMSIFFQVKAFRFLVDPVPKESDLTVETLSFAFSISPQVQKRGPTLDPQSKTVYLRSHCSSMILRLRWEILDLVEGVVKTMSSMLSQARTPGISGEVADTQNELHIVIGANSGSMIIDGINLQLGLNCQGFKGSLIDEPQSSALSKKMSLILSAQTCSTEITLASRKLMLWRIRQPNIYCSHTSNKKPSHSENDWKIAGSCKALLYDMTEDPLGLIHVVDQVVEGEVKYIQSLIQRLGMPTGGPTSNPHLGNPDHHKFHVALFLDDYQIAFRLLPSLSYSISGKVARMSIFPRADSRVEIDFDVKTNSHVFRSVDNDTWQIVAMLELPPVNGRIFGRMSLDPILLDTDITIELIKLEASAVRSLLSVLSRSEIPHLVSDLKESVEELRLHLATVLACRSPAHYQKTNKNREILYKICLTMAGMGIHARAPGLKHREYSTDMDFSFRMVQMRLDNRSEHEYFLQFPKFHINLSQVVLDLRRYEKSLSKSYGSLILDAGILGTSGVNEKGDVVRAYHLASKGVEIEVSAETASLLVEVAAHLQERIKTLDLSQDMKRFKKFRQLAQRDTKLTARRGPDIEITSDAMPTTLFTGLCTVELVNIQMSWIMADSLPPKLEREPEDLVFSIKSVTISTTKENAAKLRIEDMQLQMTPKSDDKHKRSLNSALMPEVIFNAAYLSTKSGLRLALQAAGKSLDIRTTSEFILPASQLQHSIASASEKLREANALWATMPSLNNGKSQSFLGNKRLASLLVDVDFAGATVSLLGRRMDDQQTKLAATLKGSRPPEGRFGQYVQGDLACTASLQAPGVALKVQFGDSGTEDPALNAELRVNPSTNVIYPTIVPLIKQITESIKKVVGEQDIKPITLTSKVQSQKVREKSRDSSNPHTILGRCRLNVGLRICKQKFSLSCQPIARVSATAQFDDVYMTINTVQSDERQRFFAILVAFNSLQASVKHVYSNESTASFEVKTMVMSLMNSKHLSSSSGISAILKISPMKVIVNVKQVQDFLLFREIWMPSRDETPAAATAHALFLESQAYIVQRYQQVASAGAFPWNSTIAIDLVEVQVDLGQTLGKAECVIKNLWLSSKKTSDWEQNLCIGFDSIGIVSSGRMNGSVELANFRVRTFIKWPDETRISAQTPLVQASIAVDLLQAKVSLEYQPFLVVDISTFEFIMYNVRNGSESRQDRLVGVLEGQKVQVFCTTLTASQTLALFQTWQRLAQDKQAAYEASLKEISEYLLRKSYNMSDARVRHTPKVSHPDDDLEKTPISLHTNVVVAINLINIGAFPSTFFDNQIFKMEALDSRAQFAVLLEDGKIHSALGLTLGQLGVALSGVRPTSATLGELLVNEVVNRATGSRGGTILKVPRVIASMETWQTPTSNEIEYIFKSAFEGKVDVGWNYSRISFIRGMWMNHSRALASRLGKPLPPSAVRITGGPEAESEIGVYDAQQKITAVVNVPQSKYIYRALEPPVIETPQLRDMGEATPPLEWIGLHRDKLPNIMHQIIIVALLEVAKEVEDAYSAILGSS